MLPVILIICVSLVADFPATRELYHLFGNAVQVAEQFTNTFARSAADFNVFPVMSKQVQRDFTLEEVRQCTGQDGGCLYVVFNGQVLDLTEFAPFHYGGSSMLQKYGGQDATAVMRAAGMPAAVFDVFLSRFIVGTLVQPATVSASSSSAIQTCGWIPSLMGFSKN